MHIPSVNCAARVPATPPLPGGGSHFQLSGASPIRPSTESRYISSGWPIFTCRSEPIGFSLRGVRPSGRGRDDRAGRSRRSLASARAGRCGSPATSRRRTSGTPTMARDSKSARPLARCSGAARRRLGVVHGSLPLGYKKAQSTARLLGIQCDCAHRWPGHPATRAPPSRTCGTAANACQPAPARPRFGITPSEGSSAADDSRHAQTGDRPSY